MRNSSQRDSEAAGWDTRRSYISMNRAVGAEGLAGDGGDPFAEGHAPAGNGKWGGFEYNCSCVLSGKHSFMPTEPRSQVRAALATIAGSAGSRAGPSNRVAEDGRSGLKRQSGQFRRSKKAGQSVVPFNWRVASARARVALTPERVLFTVTWSARAAAAMVTGGSRQTGCGV